MNIERTEINQDTSIIVRFKIDLGRRIEVRISTLRNGVYGKAEISISTATLEVADVPKFIAALAMAQADAIRLDMLYLGRKPTP